MTIADTLTPEQVRQFHRDGFIFVPGFFDSDEMEQINSWTDEVIAWPEEPGRHMVYYEDSVKEMNRRVVQRIENFTPYHPGFEALFTRNRLAQAIATLFSEQAVLFKEKINLKLPGGDGFKPHQDAQAGWSLYAPLHITALVSIDPATRQNGCLEVASGWHDRGLVGPEWQPLGDVEMEGMVFEAYPTQPGDAMFFDSFAPHRSAANLTDSPRRVLYVTYNRASDGDQRARYFADKRGSFPPDIERRAGDTYTFRV